MSRTKIRNPRRIPSPLALKTAAWNMRLNSSRRSHATETAFQEWLGKDVAHAKAFERMDLLWESAATMPVTISGRIGRRSIAAPRHRLRVALAGGALACLGAITLLLYQADDPVLKTSTGQQLAMTLDDGTRVTLNTDTRLRVQYGEQVRRVILESGEALFDVVKSPRRPFVVRAGAREVIALGTQFIVRYDETQTAVTLVEGKVSIQSLAVPSVSTEPERHETVLHPGERVTYASQDTATLDHPALDKAIAWKRGQVAFENTPLSAAIEEMNRYSARKLTLEGLDAASLPVSGVFRAGDAENFALALANTYPLQTQTRGNQIVISERPR